MGAWRGHGTYLGIWLTVNSYQGGTGLHGARVYSSDVGGELGSVPGVRIRRAGIEPWPNASLSASQGTSAHGLSAEDTAHAPAIAAMPFDAGAASVSPKMA